MYAEEGMTCHVPFFSFPLPKGGRRPVVMKHWDARKQFQLKKEKNTDMATNNMGISMIIIKDTR